jgi:AsmA protein
MKSLNGSGDFKLVDGLIKGVDLSALLTGLDQALTSRSLPSGIGPSYLTKFKDLVGLVKIENGVASVNKFSLEGLGVLAEGAGKIDLGNQSIDFSLRPRLTGESASNIAAFGIPIEIKGGFGNTKIGLDTDMLGQIAAERARLEASKLIKDQVGGTVGDILGGVVGGTSETGTPKSGEERIGDVLGGLLGGKTTPQNTPQETPEQSPENAAQDQAPQAEEPSVEDALLSIFGKKKKKSEE